MIYLITSTDFSGDQLSWLEHLPYKQGVVGSSPTSPTIYCAGIAQLVEQLTCNQQVVGSSPVSGTIFIMTNTYGRIAKWLNAADCKSVPSGSMVRIHLLPPLYYLTYVGNTLPRGQAVRHHTLTVACASSNLAEAAIFNICPVSSAGRAFDF